MSNEHEGFVKPTAEHEWLMTHLGRWIVDCSFYMDPSQPPMKVEGAELVEAHGQFFTVSTFTAQMMGMPFSGRATMGFDPVTKKFQSTWIDTFSPFLFHFTGTMDAAKKKLTMTGKAPAPQTQQMADWRTTEEHVDANTRKFEMFVTVPGQPEFKLFTHMYRRA
jgi:hypothetical protein